MEQAIRPFNIARNSRGFFMSTAIMLPNHNAPTQLRVMHAKHAEDLREAAEEMRQEGRVRLSMQMERAARTAQEIADAPDPAALLREAARLEAARLEAADAAAAGLAEKCAQARALMEQAQALIEEVLEDPAYDPDALPYGVCPDGVDLGDAIGMLIPELRLVTG